MQQDEFDASADKTNILHDETDLAVDAFLERLDIWSQTSNDIVGAVTIQSVTQQPFYKDQAGIYSGWLVRFQLVTSDDFEYCTPENHRISMPEIFEIVTNNGIELINNIRANLGSTGTNATLKTSQSLRIEVKNDGLKVNMKLSAGSSSTPWKPDAGQHQIRNHPKSL